ALGSRARRCSRLNGVVPFRQPLTVVAIGYDPRTVNCRQCPSSAFSALATLVSSWCPSKSMKNRYSGLVVCAGNDSIHVRLILFCLKTSSASASDPGLCGRRNISDVLLFSDFCAF